MKWSFYDLKEGILTGATFTAPNDKHLKENTPIGCGAVAGIYDRFSERIDLDTRKAIDYRPPKPSDDHEWNADTKRWVLTQEAAEASARDEAARKKIAEIETRLIRALTESQLGISPTPEDVSHGAKSVAELRDEILSLRTQLKN